MNKIFLLIIGLVSVGDVAFAGTPQTINDLFRDFSFGNFSGLIPVLVLVGLITFLAGVLRFVGAGDNEEARKAGREVMIFGIIVLFVMMSYWGFVGILTKTFFNKGPEMPNFLPPLQK